MLPWLIGAAIVGLVGVLSSDDKEEEARKAEERRAERKRSV